MSNELVTIENPQGDLEKATAMCAYIAARRREIEAEIASASDAVTDENADSAETKAELKRIADIIEDLRGRGKELVKAVCAATEAQRVITAIDSRLWSYSTKADPECAYARLTEAYKALKAKVAAIVAANRPPEPTHTYALSITCTDKALGRILKAAEKEGATGISYAVPQNDKELKKIAAWFEANA